MEDRAEFAATFFAEALKDTKGQSAETLSEAWDDRGAELYNIRAYCRGEDYSKAAMRGILARFAGMCGRLAWILGTSPEAFFEYGQTVMKRKGADYAIQA